jgi:hypothetical protein
MFPAVPCGRCSSRSPTCSRRRGKDEGFGSAAGVIRFPLVGNRCRHQRPCSISSSGVVARTRLRALRISPRGRSWWRRARAVGACVRTSAIGSRSSPPRRSDASVARSDEGWTRAGSGSGGARPQRVPGRRSRDPGRGTALRCRRPSPRPRPTARASSTSPVRRLSTSATPRTAVAAWPGSPRSRGARHSRTGLGAMGAARVAAPVASASVVPTAPRPTMPTVSRRSPGGGPGSGGPRPADSRVVESDRRLGPNGAPQPPAPRLVSGQPTCSATLGRPAAATPWRRTRGWRPTARPPGRGPSGGVVPPVRGVPPRRCKATSSRPGTPRGRTRRAGCCAWRSRAARRGTGAGRGGRRIVPRTAPG